jgi:hypothetical protein
MTAKDGVVEQQIDDHRGKFSVREIIRKKES